MRKIVLLFVCLSFISALNAQREMEQLDRGIVAIYQGQKKVYIGWRLLGTDPSDIAFNVYKSVGADAPQKLNAEPIVSTTDFVESNVDLSKEANYFVRPVLNGVEQSASESYTFPANPVEQQYLSIPVRDGGVNYAQASVGDVDGDGQYEIIFKWSKSANVDPGKHTVGTATVFVDTYKLDGTFLWRIDLGWNLEPGSDYTPLEVYDVDGDGRSEIITKTAEGTIDGTGVAIGDTDNDGITDYRNTSSGRVITGPEFMSVFRGSDGKEIARTNWIERGALSDWGDGSGNRGCRFQMGIAYLDGIHPSIIMSRGVYAYQVVETWDFRNGNLTKLWRWDNEGKGKSSYYLDNAQCFRMADVDGDGKDEIAKGQLVIDDNGKTLWTLNLARGHGDYVQIGVFDPSRSGLQLFKVLETAQDNGIAMHDAKTGEIIWGLPITSDAGRGYCDNIDSRYKGAQCWAGAISNKLLNYDGTELCTSGPTATSSWAPIWWDDVCRSLTDEHSGTDGVHIRKWQAASCAVSNYLTAATGSRIIAFIGDIIGDWREELVLFQSNELRVYTTVIPAQRRIYTLMHNPLYRLNVSQWAQRNPGPSHPDFYLGTGMETPSLPQIVTIEPDSTGSGKHPIQMNNPGTKYNCTVYPNPLKSEEATVSFTLTENSKVEMFVFDCTGKLVQNELLGSFSIGGNRVPVSFSAMLKGVYTVVLKSSKQTFTSRLVRY